MSPKGFLRKASAAKSAIAFFAAHREYLTSGEISEVTAPIIIQVDNGELLPTPALAILQDAVLKHLLNQDTIETEVSKRKPKNYVARILDEKGEVCQKGGDELISEHKLAQDVEGWVDRRLFEGASDWTGEIVHTETGIVTIVFRSDAIARMMHKRRGPTCQTKSKTTGKLSFGVKVRETHARFSAG